MVAKFWGKKIGMTQIFSHDKVVPATIVDVAHWIVTDFKTTERDGYSAVQVGHIKERYVAESFSKDWLKKPKKYFTFLREIRLKEDVQDVIVGQHVDFYTLLNEGDTVDISGKTIGRGFAGVVRRHGFAGPPGSHGATMGQRPGSIGFITAEGSVIKGKKMPGRMGNRKQMMKNLEVMKVDQDARIIIVKGSVPGKSGSLLFVRKT